MRYEELGKLLTKLEERGKGTIADTLMYFVSPFLTSLGYNTFDLDVVDIRQEEAVVYVQVFEGFSMVISLTEREFDATGKEKIYVYINTSTQKLQLFFRVLDKWKEIVEVNLGEDDQDKYVELTRKIEKNQIEKEYAEKGVRFLSEILLDYQLERGDWESDFLMRSLMKELLSPSKLFVTLMAQRLGEDYTTRNTEWIEERLQGMAEKGVLDLLKKALGEEIDLDVGKPEEPLQKVSEENKKVVETTSVVEITDTSKEQIETDYESIEEEPREANQEPQPLEEEETSEEEIHHTVSVPREREEDTGKETFITDISSILQTEKKEEEEPVDIFKELEKPKKTLAEEPEEEETKVEMTEEMSQVTKTFGGYNLGVDYLGGRVGKKQGKDLLGFS